MFLDEKKEKALGDILADKSQSLKNRKWRFPIELNILQLSVLS